jgi:DNA-binding transcriptional LysR family regulator
MIERLPDLQLFTRIVDAGSLSAAARSLGLTQPTVSKRLAAMERELAVRLVQRNTRRLHLTDEGRAWYDACRRWVVELQEVSTRLKGTGTDVNGTIRVNAPVALGRRMLMPLVLRFLELHPDATVDLTLDDRRVDLVEDNVDVAVRIGAIGNPDVVAKKLFVYRTLLCATPSYLAKRGRPRSLHDLRSHTILFYGPPSAEDVEDSSGRVRLCATSRLRTNDSGAFLDAVAGGLGIGLTSPWNFAAILDKGSLERVLPQAWGQQWPVHLIYLPSRVLPTRVRVFTAFLQKELARTVSTMPGVLVS